MKTGGKVLRVKKLLSILFGYHWYARSIGVSIGSGCRIYSRDFGNEGYLITIGDNVTVAANAKFITHDGSGALFTGSDGMRLYNFGPITIGSNVFIGANSIILPNIEIADNVVVAAGSVVTKSISKDSVVAGNPARFVKSFIELQEKARREWPSYEDCLSTIRRYKDKS